MFDVSTPKDFFFHIERAIENYESSNHKQVGSLFFIVMGLNHLREWIAPGYNHENSATKPEEHFYNNIFEECDDFKIIKDICNGVKHFKTKKLTSVEYGLFDDIKNLDDIQMFDAGPPIAFCIDNRNVEDIMKTVSKYYTEQWFKKLSLSK